MFLLSGKTDISPRSKIDAHFGQSSKESDWHGNNLGYLTLHYGKFNYNDIAINEFLIKAN